MVNSKPYSNTRWKLLANRIVSTNINFYYTNGCGSARSIFICNFRDDKYNDMKEELNERGVYMITAEDKYQFGVYLWNDDIEYKYES